MTTATMVVALLLATGSSPSKAPGKWDFRHFWIELGGAMGVKERKLLLLNLDLMDAGLATEDGSQELQIPFINFAGDGQRPSDPSRGSLSLSFLQAPLLGFMAGSAMDRKDSPAGPAALAALLLFSGGTYRWYPGGTGNLTRSAQTATSLGLMIRHQLHLHVFLEAPYFRESSGIGLVLRKSSMAPWDRFEPDFVCSVSAMFSYARDISGRSLSDPGVWFTCAGAFFGGY